MPNGGRPLEEGERDGDAYLCDRCWNELGSESREALHRQGGRILRRYRQLLEACKIGAPLQFE